MGSVPGSGWPNWCSLTTPPRVRTSRAPPRICAYRAPPRIHASRVPTRILASRARVSRGRSSAAPTRAVPSVCASRGPPRTAISPINLNFMAHVVPVSTMAAQVPGSTMAAQAPCSAVGPGMGHLSRLHVPWGLQSAHSPSPLDVVWRGTCLLGGGGLCQTCVPMSCVSLPLVPIHGPSCFLFIIRKCSCGSVVEHCVSSAKGCRFNSQGTHIQNIYNLDAL